MLKICDKCKLLMRVSNKICFRCAEAEAKDRAALLAQSQANCQWESLGKEPEPEPQWKIDRDRYKGRRAFEE